MAPAVAHMALTDRPSPRSFAINDHPPSDSFFGRHIGSGNEPHGLRLTLSSHDAAFQKTLAPVLQMDQLYAAVANSDGAEVARLLEPVVPLYKAFEISGKVQWSCADCFEACPVLSLAAGRDACAVVEALLEAGCDPHAIDETGHTALHRAARGGGDTMVSLLVNHGAALDARAHDGSTALHQGCRDGRAEAVKALLAHGADVHARTSIEGHTPLMCASAGGRLDTVQELLGHLLQIPAKRGGGEAAVKAALAAEDFSGWQPLHHACQHGHTHIAEALIEHGAVVSPSRSGQRPLALLHPAVAGTPSLAQPDEDEDEEVSRASRIKPGSLLSRMKLRKPARPPSLSPPSTLPEEDEGAPDSPSDARPFAETAPGSLGGRDLV